MGDGELHISVDISDFLGLDLVHPYNSCEMVRICSGLSFPLKADTQWQLVVIYMSERK